MFEAIEEVAAEQNRCKISGNFLHEMEPEGSDKCVALFQVNASNGKLCHPFLRLMGRFVFFHVSKDL